MIRRAAITLSFLTVLISLAPAQDPETATKARVFDGENGRKLLYRLYVPKARSETQKVPLVLFLHGAGERGDDNAAQVKHGIRQFLAQQEKHPCILVVPQCPKGEGWSALRRGEVPTLKEDPAPAMALTLALLKKLRKELPIDSTRLYVTGLSMGGYGSWDVIARHPDLFAAAVPICGGGDPGQAARMKNTPVWAFHGDKDRAVPVRYSRILVEAIKKAGGNPKYTEYPGVGHNSWDQAYGTQELYDWLFAQKKG